MTARYTYHNDGSVSIRLMPQSDEERQKLATAFSRPPGGCKIEDAQARVDVPVITADGIEWTHDDLGVGDTRMRDTVNTRRIAIGYTDEVEG